MCDHAAVLTIPAGYGLVLLTGAIMSFSIIVIGFIFAGGARAKAFPHQFLKDNFGEIHKKATGQEIPRGGYPDTGSGVYSQKLSYEQWLALNNGQRAHYNYLEFIASNLALLFISGFYCPKLASGLGAGVIVARVIYGVGYRLAPNKRVIGALLNDIFTLGQFVVAVMAGFKVMNAGVVVGATSEL